MECFFGGGVQIYTHVHPYYSGLGGRQIHLYRLKHKNGMSVLMSTSGALQPSLVNPEWREKNNDQPRTSVHQCPLSLPHQRLLSTVMSLALQCQELEITEKCKFCESPSRDKFNEDQGREDEEVSRQWRALNPYDKQPITQPPIPTSPHLNVIYFHSSAVTHTLQILLSEISLPSGIQSDLLSSASSAILPAQRPTVNLQLEAIHLSTYLMSIHEILGFFPYKVDLMVYLVTNI